MDLILVNQFMRKVNLIVIGIFIYDDELRSCLTLNDQVDQKVTEK